MSLEFLSDEWFAKVKEILAKRIFIEGDQSAGMQGFMSGQIKIEGDMSKLMALQSAQPTDEQKQLMKQIQDITA